MPEVVGPSPYAVLPAPPPTLPWYAKVIWFLANTAASGVGYLAYDYGQELDATGGGEADPPASEWRRFQAKWNNNVSAEVADDVVFTWDVINYTGGQVDNSWTTQDHDAVAAQMNAFCTALRPYIPDRYTWGELRAYRMAFNAYPPPDAPIADDKPFAESGPPTYLKIYAANGQSNGTAPPQCCTTVTEMTPLRAHWGRFYCPPLGIAAYATSGRLLTTAVDAIAVAAGQAIQNLNNNGFYLVVPTTRVDGLRARTLQNVTGLRVDDVPDVIRRRRPKNVIYRRTIAVSSPADLEAA